MFFKVLIVIGGLAALAHGADPVIGTLAHGATCEVDSAATATKCKQEEWLDCPKTTGDDNLKCACYDGNKDKFPTLFTKLSNSTYKWDKDAKKCLAEAGSICYHKELPDFKNATCVNKKDAKEPMKCILMKDNDKIGRCSGSRFDALSALFITAIVGVSRIFV